MFAWDLSGRQSSSFVLWHHAESLTLPPSPSAEPTAGGRGTGRGREFSLAGPAVSHLGSHPAKCLKQPDNEACLRVLHCLLRCLLSLLLPVAFVVGQEGEGVRLGAGT